MNKGSEALVGRRRSRCLEACYCGCRCGSAVVY